MTGADLWKRLEPFVTSGRETRKIDLKRRVDLATRAGRAKFAKDVLALANTPGGTGYLIVGVIDKRERTSQDAATYVIGFGPSNVEEFKQMMAQAIHTYATPAPTVDYEEILHPTLERKIGVFVVARGLYPPYKAKQDGEGLREGEVYFRIGADTFPATPEQLRAITAGANGVCILLNFGRPLEPAHLRQLSQTEGMVNEVIQPERTPAVFNERQSFASQAVTLVDEMGLTKEEWQTLPIVVNLPGLAPMTAALLAELHGRMGHFPKVIRLGPVGDDRSNYQVAEVIELQRMRDAAHRREV